MIYHLMNISDFVFHYEVLYTNMFYQLLIDYEIVKLMFGSFFYFSGRSLKSGYNVCYTYKKN